MSVKRGLPTRGQTSLSRELSPSLDSAPTQTSSRRQDTETPHADHSDTCGREAVADSRVRSEARPCTLFRLSRPFSGTAQDCESHQGTKQQHAPQRVSRTLQAPESMDAQLLLLDGGECLERDHTEIH